MAENMSPTFLVPTRALVGRGWPIWDCIPDTKDFYSIPLKYYISFDIINQL